MIKAVAEKPWGGRMFVFGLSEANLNRIEFNNEPIFFDFGFIDRPDLFGLIALVPAPNPESVTEEMIAQVVYPILNPDRGVTLETLRAFILTRNILDKFRSTPYWGYENTVHIDHPGDSQLVFSGPTEAAIEKYFASAGLISPKTKRTNKGFGKS